VVCVLFLATPLLTLDGHDRVVDENTDASTDGTKEQPLVFDDAHQFVAQNLNLPPPCALSVVRLFPRIYFCDSIYRINTVTKINKKINSGRKQNIM
jgi:hypothetical protein